MFTVMLYILDKINKTTKRIDHVYELFGVLKSNTNKII